MIACDMVWYGMVRTMDMHLKLEDCSAGDSFPRLNFVLSHCELCLTLSMICWWQSSSLSLRRTGIKRMWVDGFGFGSKGVGGFVASTCNGRLCSELG